MWDSSHLMRRYEESTFVFISTNAVTSRGWGRGALAAAHAARRAGARVRFLCLMHTPMGEWARTLPGVEVDPYILDKWNVIRARSRLRKYLTPLPAGCRALDRHRGRPAASLGRAQGPGRQGRPHHHRSPQATRRRRPMDALMRRFDEFGMRSQADAVFVPERGARCRSAATRVSRRHGWWSARAWSSTSRCIATSWPSAR